MVCSLYMLSSFEPYTMPTIMIINHSYMNVIGRVSIDVGDDTFNDVLCVPHLPNNLLFIYQITHGVVGNTMEFTLDQVIIRHVERKVVIAIDMVYPTY